jgi:ubiquinone/menaquinone biosynthesis C-methylase UbiE
LQLGARRATLRRVPIQSDEDKLSVYRDPAVAARYDERWSTAGGRRRDERKRRAVERGLARLGKLESVLDIPCGAGRFTKWLDAALPRYIGADAAFAMLQQTRTKSAAPLVCADLSRLPLRDASVDAVVCIRLLHLIRDAQLRMAFLREMARVARLGIVVDYRHDRALKPLWARARAALGLRDHAPNALPHAEILRELDAAGLEFLAFEPVRKLPYLSDKIVVVARRRA